MVSGTGMKTRSTDLKIQKIQDEVDATKKIMEQNIGKMIERSEKLEALKDKTEQLKTESQAFNQNTVKLKREMQFKNIVLTIVLIGAAIGAALGLHGVLAAGYAWFCLPFCSALGAGISYMLTKPMSGLFQLYQKMRFANSLAIMHPAPLSQDTQKQVVDFLTAAKPFQPHYQALKESAENTVIDVVVEEFRTARELLSKNKPGL